MPVLPFAEWVPDAAALGSPGMPNVINAKPGVNGYCPMPSHSALTDALDNYARGAIDVRDADLNVFQYAGDAAKLYVLSSTAWTDRSKVGGYSTGTEEIWEFAHFNNKVLATNWDDNIQSIAVGGTIFADLTTAFRARHIAVVHEHVVAANTFDTTDNNVPHRVRTSAIGDETDWTVSGATGSIARDLRGGDIRRVVGGQFGVILTGTSTYRMDWEGAPAWFRIDETLPGYGTLSSGAVTRRGDVVYSMSDSGMIAIVNGTTVEEIGTKKVNDFVLNDLDDAYPYRISSVADSNGYVFWAYPGPGNTAGQPNRILIYDRSSGKWGLLHQEMEMLWRAGGIGFTLEGLDAISTSIDDLEVSLDSSQWKGGGAALLAGFDATNKHGFFSGTPLSATFETKESEIHAGHRTRLNSFTPLVEGGTVTARIGSRNRQNDDVVYTPSLTQRASGRFTKRVNARFHRIELTASGDWSNALGVEINPQDAIRADARG